MSFLRWFHFSSWSELAERFVTLENFLPNKSWINDTFRIDWLFLQHMKLIRFLRNIFDLSLLLESYIDLFDFILLEFLLKIKIYYYLVTYF
jgi:hypothetical protein